MATLQYTSTPAFAAGSPAPVERGERISALDTLRGFALLGIFLMNIVAMGMFGSAYDDPMAAGGSTGVNLWVWAVLHVVAEGKMRCLFSMVFGASVILLTSRLEARGTSADIYYRRTLWLLLFGILDAYLLWAGDILYPYALCALALYVFRKMSVRALLTIGLTIALFNSAGYVGWGFATRDMLTQGRAAIAASESGEKLTEKQEQAKRSYEEWRRSNRPNAEELKKDADKWRGNLGSVIAVRAKEVFGVHSQPYYSPTAGNWDIWSMMFIGMGLFRMGALSAERSKRFYVWMVLLGYGIGLTLNSYSAWIIVKNNFDPAIHILANSSYDFGRLTVALGHLGMIMLLCKSGWLEWLTGSLGAIGQMAFSNYILQAVIGAVIFTGYGFKLYGTLQRYQLYYVVVATWVFQLIVSPIWIRHFRFGPLEWCWRSLTYWKRQPMRLSA
jgi:uncharacterized protein